LRALLLIDATCFEVGGQQVRGGVNQLSSAAQKVGRKGPVKPSPMRMPAPTATNMLGGAAALRFSAAAKPP
jgi:hypothetical protein